VLLYKVLKEKAVRAANSWQTEWEETHHITQDPGNKGGRINTMHFDVLSGLLGKSFTSKEFKAFHAGLGNQHEFIQIGSKADGFRSLPEMGIALEHCKSKIDGLEFYFDGFNGPSEPYEHWKGFVGELPHGVTIDDTRSSVFEKFGDANQGRKATFARRTYKTGMG
jgi:hypothetical protein